MTVDYKIKIANGELSITQHVDGAGSYSTQSKPVGGSVSVLSNSFAGSQAAQQGGSDPGSLFGGSDPGSLFGGSDPGSLFGGSDPGSLFGGSNPGSPSGNPSPSGQITIFGPVVIDAAGLVHKCPSGQTSEQKDEEE